MIMLHVFIRHYYYHSHIGLPQYVVMPPYTPIWISSFSHVHSRHSALGTVFFSQISKTTGGFVWLHFSIPLEAFLQSGLNYLLKISRQNTPGTTLKEAFYTIYIIYCIYLLYAIVLFPVSWHSVKDMLNMLILAKQSFHSKNFQHFLFVCFFFSPGNLLSVTLVRLYPASPFHFVCEASSVDGSIIPQQLVTFSRNTKVFWRNYWCHEIAPGVKAAFLLAVFSPRAVGVAVARYDFSSRDTEALSLLQGDIIRVYTKLPNGWWKGAVDGRVGPSCYELFSLVVYWSTRNDQIRVSIRWYFERSICYNSLNVLHF